MENESPQRLMSTENYQTQILSDSGNKINFTSVQNQVLSQRQKTQLNNQNSDSEQQNEQLTFQQTQNQNQSSIEGSHRQSLMVKVLSNKTMQADLKNQNILSSYGSKNIYSQRDSSEEKYASKKIGRKSIDFKNLSHFQRMAHIETLALQKKMQVSRKSFTSHANRKKYFQNIQENQFQFSPIANSNVNSNFGQENNLRSSNFIKKNDRFKSRNQKQIESQQFRNNSQQNMSFKFQQENQNQQPEIYSTQYIQNKQKKINIDFKKEQNENKSNNIMIMSQVQQNLNRIMKIKKPQNLQNLHLRNNNVKNPEIVMSIEGQKYIEQEIIFNNDNPNEVTHFFEENETFSQMGSLNAFAAFNDNSLNKEIIAGISQEQMKSQIEAQEKQNKIRQIHSQQYKIKSQEIDENQNADNRNEQNNDIGPLDQSEQVSFRKDETLQYFSRKVMDETVEQSIYHAVNQQVQLKKSQMNVQISGQGQVKDTHQNSMINPLPLEQSVNNPIQVFEQNQIINLQQKASIIQNRFNQEALKQSMKQSLQEAFSQGESGQENKSKGLKNSIKTVLSSLNDQSENRNIFFNDEKQLHQNSLNQNKYKKNQKILKKHISQIEKLKSVMKKKQFYRSSPNNEKIVEQISRSFELYEQKEQTLKIIKASIEEMEDLINKNGSINDNNENLNTGQSRPISRISLDLLKKQDTQKNAKSKKEGIILKLKQYLPLQEIQQLNKQINYDKQSPQSNKKEQQNSPKAFFSGFIPHNLRKYKRRNSHSIISTNAVIKKDAHVKRQSNVFQKQREINEDQLIIQINQDVQMSKNFIQNLSQKKKYFQGKQSNYIKSQKVSMQKFNKANQKNKIIEDNQYKIQNQKISAINNRNFNIHNLLNQQNDIHLKQMNSRRSLQYSKRSEVNLVQNINYNEVDLNSNPVMALLPKNQILNVFSTQKQKNNIQKSNIMQQRSDSQISQNLINADLNEFVNKSIPKKKQFQILDDIISDRQLSTKYINNSRIRETQELDEFHSSKSKQIFQSREDKLMSKYNKYKSASFKQINSHDKSSANQKSASFKLDNESLHNKKIKINNSYLIKKGIQTGVNSRQNILIGQSKNIYKSTMKLDLIVKQADMEQIAKKCLSQKKINLSTQNTQKVNLNNDSQTNRNNLDSQLIESAQVRSENAEKEFKITPDILIHSAQNSYDQVKPIFFVKNKDLIDDNNILNENQNYQLQPQNPKVNEIKSVSIISDQKKSFSEIQSNIASEKNVQKLIQEQATQNSVSNYDFSKQIKSISPVAKILSEDAIYRRRNKEEFEQRNKQLADSKADMIKSPKENQNPVNYKLMKTQLQKLGNVSMICKREETIMNQKTVEDKYHFLTQPLSINQLGFEKVMSGFDDLSFRAHLIQTDGENNFKQKALQVKIEAAQEEARLIKIEKENIKILIEQKASKEQKELQQKEMKQLQQAKDPKILEQIISKADKIVYSRLNPIMTLQNTNIELRDQSLFDLLKKNGGVPLSEQEVEKQLNKKYDHSNYFKNQKNKISENFLQKSQDIIHSLRHHNKIGTLKDKLETYIKENKKDQKLKEFTDEILEFYNIQINKPQVVPQLPQKMSKSSINSQTNIIIQNSTAQYVEQPTENENENLKKSKKKTFMKVDEYLKMKEDEKLKIIEQQFEDIEFQKISKQNRGTSYFLTREEREYVVQKLNDIHLLEEQQKQYEKEIKDQYLKKKEEKRLQMQKADMILFNNLRTKKQD